MLIFPIYILYELIEVSIFLKIIFAFRMLIKENLFRRAIMIYLLLLLRPLNLDEMWWNLTLPRKYGQIFMAC